MQSKICFKCLVDKPLSDYYKHAQMGDGHLNKCKVCTKKDTKDRHNILLNDPNWVESEQKRHREKYYRLSYKDKHRPTPEQKRVVMKRYTDKYPEKTFANSATQRMFREDGYELHHWSYNKEHWRDVIHITYKNHYKAHRFIIYDQERMMYRRIDNNELLDTKEKHEEWIFWCIKNKAD
jgi:hypothetical protein